MTPRTHPTRAAFTLIELMVTLALASMLTVAVMQLLVMIGDDYHTMPERVTDAPWLDDMAQLIGQDAAEALTLSTDAHGVIRLTTSGALDPVTLKRTHRLAEVTYRIQTSEKQKPLLVREQVLLDHKSRGKRWVELLAIGIETIDLQRTVTKDNNAPTRRSLRQNPDLARDRQVPAPQAATVVTLQCTVQTSDRDKPNPYEWTFVLP